MVRDYSGGSGNISNEGASIYDDEGEAGSNFCNPLRRSIGEVSMC